MASSLTEVAPSIGPDEHGQCGQWPSQWPQGQARRVHPRVGAVLTLGALMRSLSRASAVWTFLPAQEQL